LSEQSAPEEQNETAMQHEAVTQAEQTPGQTPPATIRAFDQYGREVMVPREEWAANILPGMLKESWDNPDQLYGVILSNLNDGFVAELTEATAHLYEIDTVPARGACMWGIALMQLGRVDEAEQVLAGFGVNHPEDGSVMVNLAKVYAQRGDLEKAESTLWHGIELEPNMENGVGWYAAIQAERAHAEGGDAAAQKAGSEALAKIAALPNSWRAQLWLAREALGAGDMGRARLFYAEALSHVARPVPAELLMQMSGDLGAGGFLQELIALTAPEFQPNFHGLPVGNNLIKAYADTGNLGAAEAIKNALYAQNRPDWKDTLGFWDAELARRNSAPAPAAGTAVPAEVQIGMLRIDGAIWLPNTSPARVLFGDREKTGPTVSFLGGTAEAPDNSANVQPQLADALGRLSRSLPLFLAEQVEMRTAAQGRAVLPWAAGQAAGQRSGFVVSGARWPAEAAVQMVSGEGNETDYVVTVHVDAEVEPWTADLVFLRTSDGTKIGELEAEFNPANATSALLSLADEVIELVSALGAASTPPAYVLPGADAFGAYLLRLEQLLAVRCASMQGPAPLILSGERDILDGDLELCLHSPGSVPVRLLLIETLATLARLRPEIAQEFAPKFQRLLLDLPMPALDEAYARAAQPAEV
jgi:tetratricopeptide (TPR) repeat protein